MCNNSEDSGHEPKKGARDGFRLRCNAGDCSTTFTGADIQSIFRSAARHWNKKHGSQLSKSHKYDEPIDQVEYGGHHLHGNAYEIRRYDVYVTSFDVARELGQIDGFIIPGSAACTECYCYIPDRDDRIDDDSEDPFDEGWTCSTCLEEQKIEQKASENKSLSLWEAQE